MMKRMNLRFLAVFPVLVILVGLVVSCAPTAQPTTSPLPPATAEVIRSTLVETRSVPGTLGYGELTPLHASGTGTLTWIAPVGATVSRGEPLFKVDEQPVVALYGSVPMYRILRVEMEGTDVQQLQENLAELGYTGFSVDGVFSTATAAAVRAWQADLGLLETGTVRPDQVVFTPGPIRIAEHTARTGNAISSSPLLSYTGLDRLVTVQLRVGDLSLAAGGREVMVTVPGQGSVTGKISRIGSTIRDGVIDVTVTIANQGALGSLDAAPVDVEFVSEERADVLTVPVAALLALAEGGYGVEVVEGDTTRFVAVRTGMFAAGRVEISGEGIAEGLMVGVPR